jgi:hypothetical protein
MTTIQFKPFFKKTFLILLICGSAFASKAQDVEQESLDWSKLRVRTFVNIPIPYTETKDIKLASILTIQGAYEIGTLADVRAAAHLGTFKGVSVGGTYHMSDGAAGVETIMERKRTGMDTAALTGLSPSLAGLKRQPSTHLMAYSSRTTDPALWVTTASAGIPSSVTVIRMTVAEECGRDSMAAWTAS